DNLEKIVHSGDLRTALQPVETMLDDIPALDLTQEEAARMKQGQKLSFIARPNLDRLEKAGIEVSPSHFTKAYATFNGTILALIEVKGAEVKRYVFT
ncbi:MAG: tRNA pseudouridine(55) synthase TruB, partial [Pseudomonadota bacterium]